MARIKEIAMMNPFKFNVDDIIEDFYTGYHYRVIIPNEQGMSILYNLDTCKNENWNSYNNCRFKKLEGQLELNFNVQF